MVDEGVNPIERGPARWERRSLTVLFTDVCGSTRLSGQLEPEVYGDLIHRVESIWHEAAQRHQGLVSRMQGDGAMLLFGVDRADERDVVHAVEAALWIHRCIGEPTVAPGPQPQRLAQAWLVPRSTRKSPAFIGTSSASSTSA